MKRLSLVMLFALGFSSYAFADWKLVSEESSLNYISIKNLKVAELNTFKSLNGSINDNGAVSINVNLGSVETKIPIRNDRMQAMFFEVGKFAEANISGSVNLDRANTLAVGDTYTDSIKLKLSLHGMSKEVSGTAQITKLTNNRLLVTSIEPVIINSEDFGLVEGVEKLREIAKLSSINTTVPVSYSFVFKQSL